MAGIAAFVGHSFSEDDEPVVRKFLDYFDRLKALLPDFTWDHAEPAEPKILSQKVLDKIRDKDSFIGICTRREYVIVPNYLKQGVFRNRVLRAHSSKFALKTSDWILQEIGLALGRSMRILLLLEQGVRPPGGLQGDLEYIPFHRAEPERAFPRILEMLSALKPGPAVPAIAVAESAQRPTDQAPPQPPAWPPDPQGNWARSDYYVALLVALIQKNRAHAERIKSAFLTSEHAKDPHTRIAFLAEEAYWRHVHLKEDCQEKLIDLTDKHPDHDVVRSLLGMLYRDYKDYERSGRCFLDAAKLTTKYSDRFRHLLNAASSYGKQGNRARCHEVLDEARKMQEGVPDRQTALLEVLREIAEFDLDREDFLAFSEGYLNQRPEEHKDRFALAYKYSEGNDKDLALYHYLLIANRYEPDVCWNNIGACRGGLGLWALAIDAYKISENHGGTLALSNMAHKMVEAGFLDEAKKICDRALALATYDQQIGTALAAIKETRASETEREEQILAKPMKRRQFLGMYAIACTQPLGAELSGRWQGDGYVLEVTISGRKFSGVAIYEVPSIADVLIGFGRRPGTPAAATRRVEIRMEGTMSGRGGRYLSIARREGDKWEASGEENTSGCFFFSEDLSSLRVYQAGSRETERFLTYERVGSGAQREKP